MDNLQGCRNDDQVARTPSPLTARRELAKLASSPPLLLETRPLAGIVVCPFCGRRHRVPVEQFGRVITADCGRGQVCVTWRIADVA